MGGGERRPSEGEATVTTISGHAEEGWGRVADAFRANFEEQDELGAACTVYRDGRPVVDLWGGVADARSGRPWDEQTVTCVFSTTKGVTAILAHMLVERGLLDLDAPATTYWPELGAEGKDSILVRWLLSHQAGLPYVDEALTLEELCSWEPVVHALERQKPAWEPGTQHAYHALTYGWLVGEVIRRITGKTPGRFFAEEVARPLGLRAWIGLPDEERPNVAHLEPAPKLPEPLQSVLDQFLGPDSLFARSVEFGGALPVDLVTPEGGFNDPVLWAGELPAGNMLSDARSLARTYAATVTDVDGVRLLHPDTVAAATVVQTAESRPFGLPPGFEEFGIQKSLGFDPPNPISPMLGPTSFGHGGAGGSLAFADPEHGVGFAYVMNQMKTEIPGPPRNRFLVDAVKECLGG